MSETGRRATLGDVARYDVVVEPLLLDRENMAMAICITPNLLDDMLEAGCPAVPVPTSDKELYDPNEVVAWMKKHRVGSDGDLNTLGRILKQQRENNGA